MRWKDIEPGYENKLEKMSTMAPHEILGIGPDADQAEIKAAYKQLVKSYHPDRADAFMMRHDQEVLKLINAAFEKLKDRP